MRKESDGGMIDPNTIDGFGLEPTSRAPLEARVVQDARTPKEAKRNLRRLRHVIKIAGWEVRCVVAREWARRERKGKSDHD